MKSTSRKPWSTLLALIMVLGLFVAAPLTANAADELFQVTENPTGASYMLNETAKPLTATFEYEYNQEQGGVDSQELIKVQWYWSNDNSTTDRSNGLGESTVTYEEQIKYTTTYTPATDVVGVKYYYAIITYSVLPDNDANDRKSPLREVVTATAKIEVIAPDTNNEHKFTVKKVDGDGNLLSGAVIVLTPNSDYTQDSTVKSHEQTTVNGVVEFTVTPGNYILSEKQAPADYNSTDDKYYIHVTANGVYIYDPETKTTKPYATVTFVNKKIPTLDKENHFAFMQGYPEGTFLPERNMTRAEAVVMFSRLLTKSMNASTDYRNNYYPDVKPTEWYANQVGYMQQLGVLVDYSRDGRFRPDDPVTRAEFATLAAHFDNLALAGANKFSDVPAAHWAVKYINSAAAKGWITGYPDGTFKPEANITRAEVVTLVGRMLDRKADSAYLTANASILPRTYSDLTTSHWAYLAIMEASMGHDYVKGSSGENWTAVYK